MKKRERTANFYHEKGPLATETERLVGDSGRGGRGDRPLGASSVPLLYVKKRWGGGKQKQLPRKKMAQNKGGLKLSTEQNVTR